MTLRHGDIYQIGNVEFYLIFCHREEDKKACSCKGWLLTENNLEEMKHMTLRKVNADISFAGIDLVYFLWLMEAKKIKEGYCLPRTYNLKVWYDKVIIS